MAKVFVSYVREDRAAIERLVNDLTRNHVDVWIDRKNLKPGHRWADAIRQGIAEGDVAGRLIVGQLLQAALDDFRSGFRTGFTAVL